MRHYLLILLLALSAACTEPQPATLATPAAQDADYMPAALREQVDALKAVVATDPSTEDTVVARSQVVFDWINAYALNGGYVQLMGRIKQSPIGPMQFFDKNKSLQHPLFLF